MSAARICVLATAMACAPSFNFRRNETTEPVKTSVCEIRMDPTSWTGKRVAVEGAILCAKRPARFVLDGLCVDVATKGQFGGAWGQTLEMQTGAGMDQRQDELCRFNGRSVRVVGEYRDSQELLGTEIEILSNISAVEVIR